MNKTKILIQQHYIKDSATETIEILMILYVFAFKKVLLINPINGKIKNIKQLSKKHNTYILNCNFFVTFYIFLCFLSKKNLRQMNIFI